ncbi:TylF/MycF/NovP-related O-methyltransferase [Peribacillus simplex]
MFFMRGFLKVHEVNDRQVWVADSFEELPKQIKGTTSYI